MWVRDSVWYPIDDKVAAEFQRVLRERGLDVELAAQSPTHLMPPNTVSPCLRLSYIVKYTEFYAHFKSIHEFPEDP